MAELLVPNRQVYDPSSTTAPSAVMLAIMELICFPGSNPLPDLALSLHLRPDRVWLAQVDGYEDRSARLANLLERHDFDVNTFVLPAFSSDCAHADTLLEALSLVLEGTGSRQCVLALGDAAGPWELVCLQVLHGLLPVDAFQVLAVVESARRLARLAPEPVTVSNLPSVLAPDDYLSACNATLRRSDSDECAFAEAVQARRSLTLLLARECAALGSGLGTLNYLASNALDREIDVVSVPKQNLPKAPARSLREALEAMQSAGLLDYDGHCELIFRSAVACRYIAGGWLEDYAWLTATELGAEHVHAGLELTWNADKGISPRNELDLFVLHHNRALTVECKAAHMGEGDTTAKILYKLDSIADRLSSLPGNAALLSAREVPELIVKRARAQDIEVFAAAGLTGFREWLKEWLDHGVVVIGP